MTDSLRDILDFALDAAWQAGRITLGYFQREITIDRKVDDSPVTIADRQSEEKLRELITARFPDHGIIGEEFGSQVGESGYNWILDPIDGTKSFIHGVPLYAVLVALTHGEGTDATSQVGIAHFPALDETIYAARGLGCYWNTRRVSVSDVTELSQAVLLASEISTYAEYGRAEAWSRLVEATPIRRTWGDAYGYALVATGRAEIMVDPTLHIWDAAPFQVILEEAGGTFTDWSGNATIHQRETIATNGKLFEQVMQLIRE